MKVAVALLVLAVAVQARHLAHSTGSHHASHHALHTLEETHEWVQEQVMSWDKGSSVVKGAMTRANTKLSDWVVREADVETRNYWNDHKAYIKARLPALDSSGNVITLATKLHEDDRNLLRSSFMNDGLKGKMQSMTKEIHVNLGKSDSQEPNKKDRAKWPLNCNVYYNALFTDVAAVESWALPKPNMFKDGDSAGTGKAAFVEQCKIFNRIMRTQTQGEYVLVEDNTDHPGSCTHLMFGMIMGDGLGLHPIFAALLVPTGGITGPDDSVVWSAVFDNIFSESLITRHAVVHDAFGNLYRLTTHESVDGPLGPGYPYVVPKVSTWFKGDPRLTPERGQLSGLKFVKRYLKEQIAAKEKTLPEDETINVDVKAVGIDQIRDLPNKIKGKTKFVEVAMKTMEKSMKDVVKLAQLRSKVQLFKCKTKGLEASKTHCAQKPKIFSVEDDDEFFEFSMQ